MGRFLVLPVAIAGITWLCNKTITNAAKGKLYTDAKDVPYNKVGLLSGTAKTGANGYHNLYYEYRIRAAVQLIKEQKIKYLVISGDNGPSATMLWM